MKKILSLGTSLLFVALSTAQTNRFFYELTYKPSRNAQDTEKTLMVLDIDKSKSVYQDYLMVSQDSLIKASIGKMQMGGEMDMEKNGMKHAKFSYRVEKTYPIKEIQYIDLILRDQVGYKETPTFKWNILPSKEKIGEYETQKAETDFGGRHWTAWFSSSLPFSDGPYKFCGLPGLIVKIEDADKNYSWEMKGNKKMEGDIQSSYILSMMGKNVIDVKREKYESMYDAYKKDPFASMREHLNNPQMKTMKMPDGRSIAEMLKEQEEKLKKQLNANNNNIELK